MRCSGCKAYMNPFMRWLEGGRRFQCNFCGALTECPTFYFAHIGADGRRSDVAERPELSKGSVELVATKDYMVRCRLPPTCTSNDCQVATACDCVVLRPLHSSLPPFMGPATYAPCRCGLRCPSRTFS